MKRQLYQFCGLLITLGLALAPRWASSQGDTLYGWEFETPGDAEGWVPIHSLSNFTVVGGVLKTQITGGDPYMFGPAGLTIPASDYRFIHIRLKTTGEREAEFFWTTLANPNFVAGLEYGFSLIPDGTFHTYEVEVGNAETWTGTVTRLRLDPGTGQSAGTGQGAEVEIDHIRVVQLGPRVEVLSFGPVQGLISVGDTVQIGLSLINTGDLLVEDGAATLTLPDGTLLLDGSPVAPFGTLPPDSVATVEWLITPIQEGIFTLEATVSGQDLADTTVSSPMAVIGLLPDIPSDIPTGVQVSSFEGDHYILENPNLRLVLVRSALGYGPLIFFVNRSSSWHWLGVTQPPGRLTYADTGNETGEHIFFPDQITITEGDTAARVTLEDVYTDEDGVTWNFQATFEISGPASQEMDIDYQISASEHRDVLSFHGPYILMGEGSFGSSADGALFPGLEWLVAGEQSSSTQDVAPPKNERYVPHPYKVTVPLMSVSYDGLTTGLIWEPLQFWSGSQRYPSPLFASPNTWEGQENHLLGLVVPPVPDWRDENEPLAQTPYPLGPGDQIRVRGTFFGLVSSDPLAAIKYWIAGHGLPDLPPTPRTYQEDVELNIESYMDVLWEPEVPGWHMALPDPWGPYPNPEVANQIWLGGLLTGEAASLRNQMEVVGQALSGGWAQLGWNWSFRYGHLDEAWSGLLANGLSAIASQNPDGGWDYTDDPALQNMPGTTLGTCAAKAYALLRTAHLSGDSLYLQKGLLALDFMDQFEVPRGAQTWEVPLHAPDILAAAIALLSYLEGYEMTGQSHYLDRAKYWAYAGLPFIYLWGADDREAMVYGSIPVFGATWYTGAWFGRVVQWNGLDYASGLLKLAEYDTELAWDQIGQGLVHFAMQIQRDETTAYPENKGMYPDAYDMLIADEPYHWDLAPNLIMSNVLTLTGLDPRLFTEIVVMDGTPVHVSAGVDLAAEAAAGLLTIALQPTVADSGLVAAARVTRPQAVLLGTDTLEQVGDVDEGSQGWMYTLDGNVIVKGFFTPGGPDIQLIDVAGLPPASGSQWEFEAEGYAEGWSPNYYLDSVAVAGGLLKARSTGPDPWFTGPSIDIDATLYPICQIRMKVTGGSYGQLFWIRDDSGNYSEEKSQGFSITNHTDFQDYTLSLQDNDEWTGQILQLRLDPTNTAGAQIEIDSIRLLPAKGDVNGDGTINILDVVLTVNFILGLQEPTPAQFEAADFNYDGQLNVIDVVLIVGYILGT
ncbi:MAG: dockerin type I domain-containing protein [bacterium]